jgi:hypothetical protein
MSEIRIIRGKDVKTTHSLMLAMREKVGWLFVLSVTLATTLRMMRATRPLRFPTCEARGIT